MKILVVITLYKLTLSSSKTFLSLCESVRNSIPASFSCSFYVHDNSASHTYVQENINEGIHIYRSNSSKNVGISQAYNQAYAYAIQEGYDWMLFCDQDSTFPIHSLSTYEAATREYPDVSLFVPILRSGSTIISPCSFNNYRGRVLASLSPGKVAIANLSAFNSGLFVSTTFFGQIGGYDERIPLDFSDHAFLHRVRQHISHMVVLPIHIEHEFSGLSKDYTKALSRFRQYIEGTRLFSKYVGGRFWLTLWTLLRSIKLSIIYRRISFIKYFIFSK